MFLALGLLAAVPVGNAALAAVVYTAQFNSISSNSIGSGVLGTITLTQNGANRIDVAVDLIDNTDFVNTGGPHTPFAFQMNVAPDSIVVTSPTGGVFFPNYSGGSNTPYGSFNYAIDYSGRNGGGHGNHGPLNFQVLRAAGIDLGNFVANGSGYYFSADVIGPAGGTGSVAASQITQSDGVAQGTTDVPEPATFALLAAGLAALGAARRRTRGA